MINTIANSRIRALHPSLWQFLIFLVKGGHSIIFLSFIFSDIVVLYSGITGHYEWFFWLGVAILGTEMVVLNYNNWRCPLTKLALAMGDETGDDLIGDYLMPKAWIPWITPVLASLFLSGVTINILRLVITTLGIL